MVADPTGDILRRRIDIQYFVDIFMVKRVFHYLFDVREVGDHAVLVEFCRLAIDDNNPVVTVQVLAFALVGQRQVVRR